MKKLFAFLLVMIILIWPAFAHYDNEIRFRDTQWGMSFSEIKKKFPLLYLYDHTSDHDTFTSVPYGIEDEETEYPGIYIGIKASAIDTYLYAGGYKVDSINMNFAYEPKGNKVYRYEKNSKLYEVTYVFSELPDYEAAATDLNEKLCSLYGNPDVSGENEYYIWNEWFGLNDTGVYIKTEKSTSRNRHMWISYFTRNGNQWLEIASDTQLKELKEYEEKSSNKTNTSGL